MDNLAKLEMNISQNKKHIAKQEALHRLQANADFIELIQNGYFNEEAIRLVMTKNAPANDGIHAQARVIRDIDAIGSFMDYLRSIDRIGNAARKRLADDEETLEYVENGGEL